MRTKAVFRGSASTLVLFLALVGCGSNEPTASGTTSPTSAGRATEAPTPKTSPNGSTSSWVALHDPASVRFSLPHRVAAQAKAGQDPSITARLYEDKVGEIGLSVSVVQAGSAFPAAYPRSVYNQMVSALTQQGATDTHLSDVGEATVAKGEALDATLSFTATDGSRNYWRMRTITAGHTMVQLQVLTFSDPGDSEALKQVDSMFTQLAESVTLD